MSESAAPAGAAFPYAGADYEDIPCNICGGTDVEPFQERDRNGLDVRSVICRNCGLMFISPRMTPEWYGRYYEVEYRRQMAAYKKPIKKAKKTGEANLEKIFQTQLKRGAWLASYLREQGLKTPQRVLEVGSSTGGLLRALADHLGCEVQGIEPSPEEAAFARTQGVPTEVGFFEDLGPGLGQQFDLVMCLQSFNHLLDPRRVAETVRPMLTPGGLFFVECQDFFRVCEEKQSIRVATQVDHVFMFVPATLRRLLETAGFEVVEGSFICDRDLSPEQRFENKKQRGLPTQHVRMLLRAGEPGSSTASSYAEVRAELDSLPDSEWQALQVRMKKDSGRWWRFLKQRGRRYRKRTFGAFRKAGRLGLRLLGRGR